MNITIDDDGLVSFKLGGELVVIDYEDIGWVSQRKWSLKPVNKGSKNHYVYDRSAGFHTMMHRMVMKANHGEIVDHINNNPLDNRRANLRLVTRCQNQMNSKHDATGTTKLKDMDMWQSEILVNKKLFRSPRYNSEDQAKAWYRGARKIRDHLCLS